MSGTSSKVEISLSYPDLVKLIEGQPDGGISIKHGIIQTFAAKHLKGLANDAGVKLIADALVKEIRTSFIENKGSEYRPDFRLTKKAIDDLSALITQEKTAIMQAAVEKPIEDIRAQVNEQVTKRLANLEDQIAKAVDFEVEKRIREGVKARMEKVIALSEEVA